MKSAIHPFIHSCNSYLLSSYLKSDPIPGTQWKTRNRPFSQGSRHINRSLSGSRRLRQRSHRRLGGTGQGAGQGALRWKGPLGSSSKDEDEAAKQSEVARGIKVGPDICKNKRGASSSFLSHFLTTTRHYLCKNE